MAEGWKRARLEDIPAAGLGVDPAYWQQWARDTGFGAGWRSIRHFFGISGFGVNASEAAAGDELVVPHDELEFGGQEELYLVLRGRARFVCDGEEVELDEGDLLYVRPDVTREARALETPTLLFMVGGVPGEPYSAWPGDQSSW